MAGAAGHDLTASQQVKLDSNGVWERRRGLLSQIWSRALDSGRWLMSAFSKGAASFVQAIKILFGHAPDILTHLTSPP
jgi:hypothetical protein